MKKKIPRFGSLGCTPKQQKVLDYLIKNKKKELSPDKIAKDLGYKESNAVSGALKKFTKFGYIQKKGKGKDVKYVNEND